MSIEEDLDGISTEHAIPEPAPEPVPAPESSETPAPESDVAVSESEYNPEPEAAPAPQEPVAAPQNDLEARLAKQEEIIQRLLSGQPLLDLPAPEQPQTPAQQLAQQVAAQAQPEVLLVTEELFDEILSDSGKFNSFITGLIKQTREAAVQEAYGLAMQHLPAAIIPTVHESTRAQMELTRWAQENPVVTQNPTFAAAVLDQIDGTYPTASIQEKLGKALDYLNSYYGAPVPQQPIQVAAPQARPAFAQPPRGGVPRPAPVSALQAELDAL